MPQLRFNRDRYGSGHLQGETGTPVSGPLTQRLHWEHASAHHYIVGGSGPLRLRLPYDVRNHPVGGPMVTVWNDSTSSRNIEIIDNDLVAIPDGILVPGEVGLVMLLDASTAVGSWWCFDTTAGGHPVLT